MCRDEAFSGPAVFVWMSWGGSGALLCQCVHQLTAMSVSNVHPALGLIRVLDAATKILNEESLIDP